MGRLFFLFHMLQRFLLFCAFMYGCFSLRSLYKD